MYAVDLYVFVIRIMHFIAVPFSLEEEPATSHGPAVRLGRFQVILKFSVHHDAQGSSLYAN